MNKPTKVHPDDRGLTAVSRVREVRERDSRIGLQIALAEQRTREQAADLARDRVTRHPRFGEGTPEQFFAHFQQGAALVGSMHQAQAVRDESRTVTTHATETWQGDRGRLRAAELLLERRRERRREERERAERAALDDLATQRWLRSTSHDHTTSSQTTSTSTSTSTQNPAETKLSELNPTGIPTRTVTA